ncbi:MAG TPA: ATP-grasp domain-containing protein [Firmicutes bacterium]|nr:ATP-grasp domain-containing protein [Bacillota bacterium]
MNILFTSAGRRVSLLRSFRRALQASGGGSILAADMDPTAPALFEADKGFLVPRVSSPDYISRVIEICKCKSISAVIPLIDPELPVLACHKDDLAAIGAVTVVCAPEAVAIGNDKLATTAFFSSVGIPTARTFSREEVLNSLTKRERLQFPMVVKPRHGSSSQGVTLCTDEAELEFYLARYRDLIVQEFLRGEEVTIDILGDGKGNILSAVPRKRLKVRGGEVERGITVDDAPFREFILEIGRHFKPFGAINVQCFVTEKGPVFTEINPRFGGGYPLADAAGAGFPELILMLIQGTSPEPRLGRYQRGLVMCRFDDAFFVSMDRLSGVGGPGGSRE